MYKDKEKQKQAQREWVRQRRAKDKGSTSGSTVVERTITDACGNVHPIDFEGRRETYNLLESWAKGEGTAYQQTLGLLNRTYTTIKDTDLQHYLGYV